MQVTQLNKKSIAFITSAIGIMISRNASLPIFEMVAIKNGDLMMSDYDVHLTLKNVGIPGEVCLWSEELKKVLKVMPEFIFTTEQEARKEGDVNPHPIYAVFASPDQSESMRFSGSPLEDFIKIPSNPEADYLGHFSDKDVASIKTAGKFVSTDTLRPAMMCVAVSEGHIVGTDAHLLYFEPTQLECKKALLLPKKVRAAIDLLHSPDDPLSIETFKYSVTEERYESTPTYCRVWNSMGEIIFKPYEDTYPDWPSVIPQKQTVEFTISKALINPVLDKALLQANKTTHQGRFTLNEQGLSITAEDIDFAREYSKQFKPSEIKVKLGSFETFTIGFNMELLQKAIAICGDPVTLRMSDPARAGILNGNMLVMPVMLLDNYNI